MPSYARLVSLWSPWMPSRLVDAHQYVGIKHRDKPFEVSAPQSREKRIDHSSLFRKMGARVGFLGLNPASRAAGKLPRSFRRSIKDCSNLVERDREYVVPHEGQTFVRVKPINGSGCRKTKLWRAKVASSHSAVIQLVAADSV